MTWPANARPNLGPYSCNIRTGRQSSQKFSSVIRYTYMKQDFEFGFKPQSQCQVINKHVLTHSQPIPILLKFLLRKGRRTCQTFALELKFLSAWGFSRPTVVPHSCHWLVPLYPGRILAQKSQLWLPWMIHGPQSSSCSKDC